MIETLMPFFVENEIVRWVLNVLDVLLVWFIVYKALALIKGTKAVQVLMGLVIILTGFGIAKFLGLQVMTWIMETFASVFLFVVLVIFQHDIRKGLSRLGRNPFFQGASTLEEVFFVEELVKASQQMSAKRIGSLIVIERDADLTDYSEEGTLVDARVSKELILSIMHTTSPMHDGAILIQGGRLSYAGCFLPLSNNPKLSRELGTRHRAALGISEETDAAVIVVSEESGKISFVINGNITRDLDPGTLKKVLLNTLGLFASQNKPKQKKQPAQAQS